MKQLKLTYRAVPLERKQAVAIAWAAWERGSLRQFDEQTGKLLKLSGRSVREARLSLKINYPRRCPLCRQTLPVTHNN